MGGRIEAGVCAARGVRFAGGDTIQIAFGIRLSDPANGKEASSRVAMARSPEDLAFLAEKSNWWRVLEDARARRGF